MFSFLCICKKTIQFSYIAKPESSSKGHRKSTPGAPVKQKILGYMDVATLLTDLQENQRKNESGKKTDNETRSLQLWFGLVTGSSDFRDFAGVGLSKSRRSSVSDISSILTTIRGVPRPLSQFPWKEPTLVTLASVERPASPPHKFGKDSRTSLQPVGQRGLLI